MTKLVEDLQNCDQHVQEIWARLVSSHNERSDISGLLAEYTKGNSKKDTLIAAIVTTYQMEIVRQKETHTTDHLSEEQKTKIKTEMRELEDISDKNIRGCSVLESAESINPLLFQTILEEFSEKCPLVHDIIQSFVISNPRSRNILKSNNHKILCGLQTLGFMSNIRNSKTQNCFPLMFGLLSISYGAGERFINMLQSMGLSLHWSTM